MADLSVTAGSVLKGDAAQVLNGIAGGAITAGMPIYADESDSGKIKAADADAVASAAAIGVSLHAAGTGQPISYQTSGTITAGATLTKGAVYYVSTTAGGLCPLADLSSGDFPTLVYLAISTTQARLILSAVGSAL